MVSNVRYAIRTPTLWHAWPPMPRSSEALIAAIAVERDRDAFRELFAEWAPRFKGFVVRRGVPPAQADDLVQDILLTVWRKADRYDAQRASAATWLFTIARNRMIDCLRREQRPTVELDDPALVSLEPAQTVTVEKEQESERIRGALASLPDEQSVILRRAYFGGETLKGIALDLELPEGTVKSRVRLALQRLRTIAEGWDR
jgi:RNA polymerase sigma-70 factor (ECF subfamily)